MKVVLFYIFYGVNWTITLLPLPVLYGFSDFFYFVLYYLVGYRKKVIQDNLRNSFPGISEEELKRIHKKFMHNLCDVLVESLKSTHLSEKEARKRMKYINTELLDNYFKNNKSVISVCGHYCNWEWYHTLPFASKHTALAVYKPLTNKLFDNFLNNIRVKFNLIPVEMNKTLKTLMKMKDQGVLTNALFASDQSPIRSEINYWTQFLNQETAAFLGVEKIAKKLDMPVVFVHPVRVKRGYYEVTMIPVCDNPAATSKTEITEKHMQILEKIIKEDPTCWMWSHKRWKYKKPE